MKGSSGFKKKIEAYLNDRAAKDLLFAETLKKKNKSIDECINYILGEVQKSGIAGYDPDEIYRMAVHYYDEDDLKATKFKFSGMIVLDEPVQLTEEDKKSAREKAIEKLVEQEKSKIKLEHKVELNEQDIAEVKKKAIEDLVQEQKAKMLQKKTKAASKAAASQQPALDIDNNPQGTIIDEKGQASLF